MDNRIYQIGNLVESSFKNPTVGRVYDIVGLAPTLSNSSGGGRREPFIVVNDMDEKDEECRIRKLTPKEYWRLMGFSDEDFQKAQDAGISNTQLYKQAGNSIVVDILYYIFKELYDAMPYLFDDLKVGSYFSGIGAVEKGLDKLYKEINRK